MTWPSGVRVSGCNTTGGEFHIWWGDARSCACGRWYPRGTKMRRWQEVLEYLRALYV